MKDLHIGKLIEAQINEIGMSKAEFGRRINTSRQNVNTLLAKDSIDLKRLALISKVLRYNFFTHISEFPEKPEASAGKTGRYFVLVEVDKDERDQFMSQFP